MKTDYLALPNRQRVPRPLPEHSSVPVRLSRFKIEVTCSRIAARRTASPASKPLASITRSAISLAVIELLVRSRSKK
jgi:hypothetical protein